MMRLRRGLLPHRHGRACPRAYQDKGSCGATASTPPSWQGLSGPPVPARARIGGTDKSPGQPGENDASAHPAYCIDMTTASPPKLNIRPERLAFRCMITPASFCSQRSPMLALPMANP